MKKTLRASVLIAFAVFIALTLGAARMAHVFSNRALLEEELKSCGKDLEAVTAKVEELIEDGGEAEGIDFFGEKALLEWARHDYGNAAQTCESLLDKLRTFRGHTSQNDDIAILTIRIL